LPLSPRDVTGSRTIVFLGPSLERDAAQEVFDCDFRPPAGRGDVLSAALEDPPAIALVDGRFDSLPSVWHKEILWALSTGIPVYGAASMGALRAAELDRFGMCGVGQVYRAYRDGSLEDDDEVAVAHAGMGEGWRLLSDAMVDVRHLLRGAVGEGVISETEAGRLTAEVKCTFYARRSLRGILELHRDDHRRLQAWLQANPDSVKREDVVELLRLLRDRPAPEVPGESPALVFSRTAFFDALYQDVIAARALAEFTGRSTVETSPGVLDVADSDPLGQLLDEVRLVPDEFHSLLQGATAAALALHEAERLGEAGGSWGHRSMIERFRRAEALFDPEDVDRWLSARAMSRDDLDELGRRWSAMDAAQRRHASSVERQVLLSLAAAGQLVRLRRRADEKAITAASAGSRFDRDGSPGPLPDDEEILQWYFDGLGVVHPSQVRAWAQEQGWRDAHDLLRALRREWLYAADGAGNCRSAQPEARDS
jgi:hypothetical protein